MYIVGPGRNHGREPYWYPANVADRADRADMRKLQRNLERRGKRWFFGAMTAIAVVIAIVCQFTYPHWASVPYTAAIVFACGTLFMYLDYWIGRRTLFEAVDNGFVVAVNSLPYELLDCVLRVNHHHDKRLGDLLRADPKDGLHRYEDIVAEYMVQVAKGGGPYSRYRDSRSNPKRRELYQELLKIASATASALMEVYKNEHQ